jgi:prevent-host-death family protein
MTRLDIVNSVVPISEFRSNASPILKKLREDGGVLLVTHNGYSAAVMMGVEEYQRMELQIQEYKAMVEGLADALKDNTRIQNRNNNAD